MSRETEQRCETGLTDREADRQVETESNGVEMDSQKDCGYKPRDRHNEDFSTSKGQVQNRPWALLMEEPYHCNSVCFRD